MLQSALFLVIAGIPSFLFLRRIRALRLSSGYAAVLAVPIAIVLWLIMNLFVDLGRL